MQFDWCRRINSTGSEGGETIGGSIYQIKMRNERSKVRKRVHVRLHDRLCLCVRVQHSVIVIVTSSGRIAQ